MKKAFVVFLGILITFSSSIPLYSRENLKHYESKWNSLNAANSYVDQVISRMSLKEKVGQLLMVGIKGKSVLPETQKLISELKLGGIIFYSHNVKDPYQVRTFTSDIQETAKESKIIPLFIAVDQEGGSVVRIRKNAFVLPAAMAIGATRSSQFSFQSGKMTAQGLFAMGVNMNLAPVLDINTTDQNAVIGIRSYGSDPSLVSQLGMWYIEGLQSQGVIATAKHFPGHGDTFLDSHYAVPVLSKSLNDLENFHLIPFRKAIDNGLDAIMTAHISIPALDSTGLPATFSYNLLTQVIRNKMGFEGIVITDDLEMKSIQNHFSTGQAALKAILAGADIVMISWSFEKKHEVFKTLYEALQTGKLNEKRLDESVRRIIKLKLKRGFFNEEQKKLDLSQVFTNAQNQALIKQIAVNAVTVVFNKKDSFPLEKESKRVLIVTSVPQFYKNAVFFHSAAKRYSIVHRPTISQRQKIVSDLIDLKSQYDFLIFGITHSSQVDIINEVSQSVKKDIVVVSFGSPYLAKKLKPVSSFICSYDTQPEIVFATAQILAGVIRPSGKLPVSLNEPPLVLADPSTSLKTTQR